MEDVIRIFNQVKGTDFIILYNSEPASTFAPGIKKQSVTLFSVKSGESVFTSQITQIPDASKELNLNVMEFLFSYGTSNAV